MNIDQFKATMPLADAEVWFVRLVNAMAEFRINTPLRQAAFLATLAHESDQLRAVAENLNYSADGLAKTWPHRYAGPDGLPNALAISLHRNPEAIANNVYAGRMGNGDEASGDGWVHRGAGPIQITGKSNQSATAAYFGMTVKTVGDWMRTPEGGARSSARLWNVSGCNVMADIPDFDAVSDLINIGRHTEKIGDSIGYVDRLNFYNATRAALGA